MNQEFESVEGKKSYVAPQLRTISLRPEEAVLGHCKTAGTGGAVQATCTFVGPCTSVGS